MNLRTEKALKKASIEATHGAIVCRKNGNHAIIFYDISNTVCARTTIRQIVGKLYKRKVKA